MTLPIRIDITVSESEQQFDLTVVETNIPIAVDVGTAIVASIAEDYDGEYDITPSSAEQVFQTEGKRVLHDFIVEPIPQNYGLITYNGSTITVS